MPTKKCSKCKEILSIEDFNKKKSTKDGLDHQCRACNSKHTKSHYQRNKQYYKNKAEKRDKEFRQWYIELKKKYKCADCVENHPACIDFHHLDKQTKLGTVSQLASAGHPKEVILEEIEKCIPLCANCHRKRHCHEDYNGE